MTLYMDVTNDKYELPMIVADSAVELARRLNVKTNSVYSAMKKAVERGQKSRYVRVVCDD